MKKKFNLICEDLDLYLAILIWLIALIFVNDIVTMIKLTLGMAVMLFARIKHLALILKEYENKIDYLVKNHSVAREMIDELKKSNK